MDSALPKQSRGFSRPALGAIAAVLVVYVVSLLMIDRQGFWIVDNENEFPSAAGNRQ